MKLVIATKNKGKLSEIKDIFSDTGLEIVGQQDIGINDDIIEDGITFEENAFKKANGIMQISNLPTLADDSGLEVSALGGAPGVFSARYGGENATDGDKIEKLLSELIDVKDRSAKFVCVICVVYPNGDAIYSRGECEGEILFERKGEGGFGYDPVFYIKEYGETFSQMSSEIKNKISHRAKALSEIKSKLIFQNNNNKGEFI